MLKNNTITQLDFSDIVDKMHRYYINKTEILFSQLHKDVVEKSFCHFVVLNPNLNISMMNSLIRFFHAYRQIIITTKVIKNSKRLVSNYPVIEVADNKVSLNVSNYLKSIFDWLRAFAKVKLSTGNLKSI